MQLLHVGAAVLNQTPLAWDANQANVVAAIEEARRRNVSILCLPELCISGYGCEDAFLSSGVQRMAWRVLEEIVPQTHGMIVSLGLPLLYQNALYDVACLAVDGRIAGFTAKRYLAGDGIHYEPRWFKPWPLGRRVQIVVDGHEYPLGDIYFDCGGVRIGFEICEDAWVANRPGIELSQRGVDVILNPSASHFAFGKTIIRERFVLEGSRAFGVHYVYSNLVGNEAGRAIYDGDALIASAGKMIAAGPRFSFAQWGLTSALVDMDAARLTRARTGSFTPDLTAVTDDCIHVPFTYLPCEPMAQSVQRPAWENSVDVKEEEFARAISLALFDYMRKSRSRGFVVSISGGADSAAVSCLIALMVKFGVAELGREAFLTKLSYFPEIQTADNEREMVQRLLACVYQSTRNSGEVTLAAARGVAEAIGADFFQFDIDRVVQEYLDLVSQKTNRTLSWKTDDLALQNIQARARAPSAWLLANLRGALLASTSNRSEAAVGYATMDGDTSGGISPIAGIDKAFLRRWLLWLETIGPQGFGPIPALHAVNVQAPTAELRPPSAGQTDEADLMPYDVLDAIERAAIRDKHSPMEVFKLMRTQFVQYSAQEMLTWVERFFRLWSRNQWKRERYAPSFHVDDENLDPKTWCRFPILSGGYERELTELHQFVLKLPKT
ncbi:MAG TPA: NAD(+) synthase [Pirellulales bacterium]|jgi:NAD+ synthase (glutamine-hydrolysing)|nr:NAD(+) synthase [Pirellulales bacterium]